MADAILSDVESSGIYQIRNLRNGKRYIGSAKCFRKRWQVHRSLLDNGKHHSRHLQASWRKRGASAFAFEIIELCGHASLLDREQYWLDSQYPAYNVCKRAGNTLGYKFSPESKAKIGLALRGRKMPPRSAETRAKISAIHKGRKKSKGHAEAFQEGRRNRVITDEVRAKIGAATKQRYASGAMSRDRPPEYREKIASTLRGRKLPKEVREKISLAQKGKKKGPYKYSAEGMANLRESGKRLSESRKGCRLSPESIAKMAASMRGKKASDAAKAKLSTASKNRWADPEFRERMSAIHKTRWEHKRRSLNEQSIMPGI